MGLWSLTRRILIAVVGARTDIAVSPKTDDDLPDRTKALLGTHVVFPTSMRRPRP